MKNSSPVKKKRHPIRNTLFVLLCVAVLAFGAAGAILADFSDSTPEYSKSYRNVSTPDYLSAKAIKSVREMGLLGDYEYLFNGEEINELLATTLNYIDIPTVSMVSAYVDIASDNYFEMEAPCWIACFHSAAKANGYLSKTDDTVIIQVEEVKLGRISSKRGNAESILSQERLKEVESSIRQSGVMVNLEKKGQSIYASMTIKDMCQTIVNCCDDRAISFLSAAVYADSITTKNVEIKVNENGLTGIVVHKRLLL